MGLDNQMDEDFMGRGWSAPDKFVCPDCVEDNFLKKKITRNLAKRKCDYCGRSGRGYIAAPVAAIMEHIGPTFHYYFADPDHAGVPYDGGDYAISPNITAEDGLSAINLGCHETLFADIAGSIGNDMLWVEARNGVWLAEDQNEYLSNEWKRFTCTVKHENRFFFSPLASAEKKFPSQYTPVEMLTEIGMSIGV
ncbi:MAG: HEPN-associated N-terminal domain-containing protein [Pseudomonadota bacterium]